MDIPALPFSKMTLTTNKPLKYKQIENPATLGERLRNERIRISMYQKDLAELMNVTEDTITNWELNKNIPSKRHMAKVFKFLSYIP